MKYSISVIIPTHCRSVDMLDKAVESVKNQSLGVFEIIIVDDNNDYYLSTSIKTYCNNNKLIYFGSGGVGAAAARNIGIYNATGDYIAFLDDDDTWMPNKLEMQMTLFSDASVGLVYSRGYTIKNNTSGELIKKKYATDDYYKSEVDYTDLLEKNYIGTTTQLIVRKNILIEIHGFDESLPSRQDYDLCLRIAKLYRCIGANHYLFIHNIHSANQITSNPRTNMIGYIMLYKKYKSDIRAISGAKRKWYYRITRCALAASSYIYFSKYLFLAIIDNPLKAKETLKKCTEIK